MRSAILVLIIAAIAFLSACGDRPKQGIAGHQQIAEVTNVAWLSRRLPASTIGYLRLPLLWDAWFRPRADALGNPQSLPVHTDQVNAIRAGLASNIWQHLPEPAKTPLRLLFNQIESPLEVAFLLPPDGSLVPNFLLGTTLALEPDETFAGLLDELVGASDQLRILTPLDDRGYATLFAGPLPVYVNFEDASGRLRMLSGTSATQSFLEQTVALPESASKVTRIEQGLDASGRGVSVWLDVATLWPQARTMVPAGELAVLQQAGLDELRSLWLGSVARGGRSQLRLELEMPANAGFRRLLPTPDAPVQVVSRGAPNLVVRLGLPSRDELGAAADFVLDLMPDGATARANRDEILTKFRDWMGVDAAVLLDAYGPEVTLVSDDAGWWAAYQVRDEQAAGQLTDALVARSGTTPQSRTIDSVTYHSWSLPSLFAMSANDSSEAALAELPPVARDILSRLGSHLFWTEESPYRIAAGVPQVLMARNNRQADTHIGDWLAGAMGIDSQHSLALLALRNERGARDVYHYYLALLLFLADVAGVDIDPYAMPAWDEARLPAGGGVALGLQSEPEKLSVHINFQYSPMEMLLGTDLMLGVAVMGIAAAIAVPAYQDYRARAEVSVAIGGLAPLKLAVAEQWHADNSFPAAADLATQMAAFAGSDLDYDADTGSFTLYFSASKLPAIMEGYLTLTPTSRDDQFYWECTTDLGSRFLPPDCR